MGRLISLAVISGIFSKKDKELDILPPPPPFPKIGTEGEEAKEAERTRRRWEKEREREEKRKKREEAERKKAEEMGKRERELRIQKQKEKERKKKEDKKRKVEEEKQKQLEETREDEERKKIELEKKRFEEKRLQKQKKPGKRFIFGKIFGEKKEEYEFAKELAELEKAAPKPSKKEKVKVVETKKLGIPELISPKTEKSEDEVVKPEEVVKEEEEEIQKAIKGMGKAKKKPSIVKGLFKKKDEPVAVEEKIETPGVMPRTYDKIDHVELIEGKIHKARLALMDFKFDEAKRIYIEIMNMYNNLEPKKKSKVYPDIKDLYYERKSAEKFAK